MTTIRIRNWVVTFSGPSLPTWSATFPAGTLTADRSVCSIPTGRIVAFNTNTSDHNLDGWSEHAESRDGGKTWKMYNRFPYSFEAYSRDPKRPAWIEAGLVTSRGTVVVFVTHFPPGRQPDHERLHAEL